MDAGLLDEQANYYRARAGEYDRWWRREGRYDRGPEATATWNAEVAELDRVLAAAPVAGDVLELAAGTGWWTERLARRASTLTCVDASSEMLERNRQRLRDAGLPPPRYEPADLFAWRPARRYDLIFFSFWLSHVPRSRFRSFWNAVGEGLAPGGSVLFFDSLREPTSGAPDHSAPDGDDVQRRLLDDGRAFRVVKRFYDRSALDRDLRGLGWEATIGSTERYFLFGRATRAVRRTRSC